VLARSLRTLRTRPGRTAALGLVVLLALGAVVAAVSGGDVAGSGDAAGAGRELTSGGGHGARQSGELEAGSLGTGTGADANSNYDKAASAPAAAVAGSPARSEATRQPSRPAWAPAPWAVPPSPRRWRRAAPG
jgi:hypothetical protein